MYLWGNGRYGQLAGTGANLMLPTLAPSLLQTQQVKGDFFPSGSTHFVLYCFKIFLSFVWLFQVVCGQNCTFLLQSNGTVLAIGEGQYGRLGQGNSDDLYVPTIISAFQGLFSGQTWKDFNLFLLNLD